MEIPLLLWFVIHASRSGSVAVCLQKEHLFLSGFIVAVSINAPLSMLEGDQNVFHLS